MPDKTRYIRWFSELGNDDVPLVGGKNASLGEMIRSLKDKGIRVPDGFATTADAYRKFLDDNSLNERIRSVIDEMHSGSRTLHQAGKDIRQAFRNTRFPDAIESEIRTAYRELSGRYSSGDTDVAVRSSATAEDLPGASFAGQQETFLNISGEDELLDACRRCYASLFTDRAISYREEKGFEHMKVALSVGIQKMVRSDRAGAGVMFTLDTETGFREVVTIDAAWGLGENVVQGSVNPDAYQVYKPLLGREGYRPIIEKALGEKAWKMVYASGGSQTTRNVETPCRERNSFVLEDREVLQLAEWAVKIERHYGRPMDIEWAKDGDDGSLYIVQARPETVQSQKKFDVFRSYALKERGEKIIEGLAIGQAIASGKAQVLRDASEIERFEEGAILVTGMTDPDWVPVMKKAAGIITDHGGRTSHAAIVSRELGVPAVVGTGKATEVIPDNDEITLSCAEGETGVIYRGALEFETNEISLENIPETETRIMMNISSPSAAFRWWRLPVRGIGLARMEFIINNIIRIHPMALVRYDDITDRETRKRIDELTRGYEDKTEYFVDHLARGIAKIAASRYPDPVIVRLSDFKTNEYANLIGGRTFEPEEENPMLGFRGASRYYSERYREGFDLECRAILRVREEIGFDNVVVMIPFCRTPEEADRVLEIMAKNGLRRGENGLQVYIMCEIPSNVVLADRFSERVDGFSIGSNDLTQLVLGVDRDSEELKYLFDERNEAVKRMIAQVIEAAHRAGKKVGLCGQGPSDHPELAGFLVESGIDSISVNPDSVVNVIRVVAETEERIGAPVS